MLRVVASAALGACGAPPEVDDAGSADGGPCRLGAVEVGGSGGRFIALPASGGELNIVRGAQGGIHVLVGFRVHDVPLELRATYRLRDPVTGAEVAPPTLRMLGPGLYRTDASGVVRVDDLIVLDNDSPRVEDFAGRMFLVEVEVLTSSGVCAIDTRLVTLR